MNSFATNTTCTGYAPATGGTGYIQGTMLGALVIGLLDTFGKAYVPKVALFFAWIVFLGILLLRPSGLIGRKVF